MPKIEPGVRDALWKHVAPSFEEAAHLYAYVGLKARRGETKKDVTKAAILELAKLAYQAGLDRGYDMAAAVFADEPLAREEE